MKTRRVRRGVAKQRVARASNCMVRRVTNWRLLPLRQRMRRFQWQQR